MSWRDTIKNRSNGGPLVGSFREAKFVAPGSEASVGRRVEIHEYPLRDIPYAEDFGKKARKFSVDVFVDDTLPGGYLYARDTLILALEEEGPGSLVHPWYGTMRVSLAEPATVRESTREGGRASFHLVFVEAGELIFPTSAADTQAGTDSKADAAITAASNSFVKRFKPAGLPDWSITELAADLYTTLAQVEKLVKGVTAPIAAEIRSPGNMAAAIIGAVQGLAAIVTEPLRAVSLYKRLFAAGDDSPAVPATTTIRRQQAASSAALHRLVQQTAVISAARSSSEADYQTSNDALATAATLEDALDTQMEAVDPVSGTPVDDAVYQSLADLRVAVVQDLRTRGARLPDLITYSSPATLPALVIAHRLYGDAGRAGEIIARNNLRHPGFVPGGEELETLNA